MGEGNIILTDPKDTWGREIEYSPILRILGEGIEYSPILGIIGEGGSRLLNTNMMTEKDRITDRLMLTFSINMIIEHNMDHDQETLSSIPDCVTFYSIPDCVTFYSILDYCVVKGRSPGFI